MQSGKLSIVPIVGAFALLLANAFAVAAYEGQVPAQIILDGACRGDTLVALVKDATGAPVADQEVVFSFVQKADDADSIAPPSATTDQNGRAVTGLNLADVPGTRIIKAEAGELEATLTIECRAGLPPTSTAPDEAAGTALSTQIALVLAIAGLAAMAGLMLRRRVSRT